MTTTDVDNNQLVGAAMKDPSKAAIERVTPALMTDKDARTVNREQAAEMLGVSVSTFRRRFEKGLTRVGNGHALRFAETEVAQLRVRIDAHKLAVGAPLMKCAIPMEAYGRVLDDLRAGLHVIDVARAHGLYLTDAEVVYRDFLRLQRSLILDNAVLVDLWTHLFTRFRETRPEIDSAAQLVQLFKKLADEADCEDAQRACRCCPTLAQRRATLCEVCAESKFVRRAPSRGRA